MQVCHLRYLTETEVYELNQIRVSNHDILWFNVSVNYILNVTVFNCLCELLDVPAALLLAKCLVLLIGYLVE